MTAHFAPWAAADKEPRSFRQLSPWVHSRLAALGPALGAARKERRAVAGFGLWTTRITAVLSTLVHHGMGHQPLVHHGMGHQLRSTHRVSRRRSGCAKV